MPETQKFTESQETTIESQKPANTVAIGTVTITDSMGIEVRGFVNNLTVSVYDDMIKHGFKYPVGTGNKTFELVFRSDKQAFESFMRDSATGNYLRHSFSLEDKSDEGYSLSLEIVLGLGNAIPEMSERRRALASDEIRKLVEAHYNDWYPEWYRKSEIKAKGSFNGSEPFINSMKNAGLDPANYRKSAADGRESTGDE